jgi:AraC-like DNA-binding protein
MGEHDNKGGICDNFYLYVMKIERFAPVEILRPFIKTFMIIESEEGMVSNILPDTSLVIAFRYRGSVTAASGSYRDVLPAAVISGIRSSARSMTYDSNTANLLVIFHDAGAAAFFREPLHELSDLSLPLDTLLPARVISEVEEQLAEAASNRERVDITEKWLLTKLSARTPDPMVQHAIQRIQLTHGAVRIADLARELFISQDAFEKRFRRQAGASPKQFSSIVRFKQVIAGYPHAANLTDAALSAGYFDQAHFIKAFKAFTGKAPQEFFHSVKYW